MTDISRTAAGTRVARRWNLRGLSVISFAHGVNDFYSGIVPFAIFLVLSHERVSPGFQGAFVFLWYLTSSIVQPLFGAYTDRFGKWWFLPSAVALTTVSICIAAGTTSLPLLAGCTVVGGFGSALMHPEAGKYSAMLSGDRRAGGISIFQIGGQIGYSLGPAAIALTYARFGSAGSALLFVPGAVAVAALFLLMRRVDRSAVDAHAGARAAAPPHSGRIDRNSIALLVGSTGLRYFVAAAFMTYLPNLLVSRGASIPEAGQVVTAFLLVSSVGLFAGGSLSDRFGAVPVSIGALVAAVPFLLGFFWFGGPLSLAALLLGSALLAVQNAPGVALAQSMLPENLGTALGLMNGVAFGAGSALVAVLGIAVARAGAAPALESVSLVPVLAALGYLGVRRPRNH